MVFASLTFLFAFLPLVLIGYFLFQTIRARNAVLVAASLLFYAWGEPIWVILLVFSAVVDYLCARFIERFRGRPIARAGLIASLVINLSLLAGFKYAGFFAEVLNTLLGTTIPMPQIALPIGISFYTFQTISYTVDVYRGHVTAQRSFLNFLLFVSLFPQLVAGPIVRYADIAAEIDARVSRWDDVSWGIDRFCSGLFKKVVFANTAGALVATFLDRDLGSLGWIEAWFGLLMFTLQIYYDFSGYSDMAIGMGRMFGFRFLENFNYPYVATSIRDFWRRWHISLGSFFRDYVYIPLGGSRTHLVRNTAVVWTLTGLWHGASWNFVLWGCYFGVLLLGERFVWGGVIQRLPVVLRHGYAMMLIVVGWALFYFTSAAQLLQFLRLAFSVPDSLTMSVELRGVLQSHVVWLSAAILFCVPLAPFLRERANRWIGNAGVLGTIGVVRNTIALAVATALLVADSYNPFLYFRF